MRDSRRRLAAASAIAVAALALGTAATFPATAAEAAPEGVIQNAGAPGTIAGSYIVTLKESAPAETSKGRAVAAKHGATIKKTYTAALNGYNVELSEAQAKKLAGDPAVASVVQNRVFTVDGTQPSPPSWGLDRIDQRALPLNQSYTYPDSAGQGVTAYIIDTGVRISHSDFGGRAFNGYDAIDNDNVAQDGHGHGTHVAGAAAVYLADNPSATPAQVSTALTSAATPNVVGSPGTGSPNRLLFVGGGGTTPPPGKKFENTADFAIADNSTVESPVTVTGVAGNAPSALQVPVNIVHTYIGDLQVQLIAPDGTAYTLKAFGTGGSSDNINTTYTVNASSEVANGTWKLRVTDNANIDTGKIDSWALQF
ncbi:proprotein convertase P-domain-containing protein [Streptomyces sp. NPDC058579]|uniref:proprotein convertase P-domain-containing protein n=1 Tax=Streptomyces sp. NPDC058579 TaxID=3346548 RepID=UPI003656824C